MAITARTLTRIGLAALSCAVLVGLSIAFVDRPLSTYSHEALGYPAWSKVVTGIVGARNVLVASIVALLVIGGLYWRRGYATRGMRTALIAVAATLLATALVIALKIAFGRLWPETWVLNNPSWIRNHQYGFMPFHGGAGYESFPSGHTARVTAPFAVLWQRLPRLRVLWVLPPLVIIAGLIFANFHFMGDCIGGVYVGVTAAAIALALIK
jgi:membrane-associated phospholipid phosphatase